MSTAKQFETLRAEAALAGVTLVASTDDRDLPIYIASRWALTRTFLTLAEVAHWLAMVTGKKVAMHEEAAA
jgi:hypothetical protein